MRLTFGQLIDATNAKRIEQWDHTAYLLHLLDCLRCQTYNANREKGAAAIQAKPPIEFNPYRRPPRRRPRRSNYTADKISAEHDRLVAEGKVCQVQSVTVL